MSSSYRFVHDERLGIKIPEFDMEWATYSHRDQEAIIGEWEKIKARIPDRIEELEREINQLQMEASQEDDWDRVCALYEELYTIASVINDLNIWKLVEPHTTAYESEQHLDLAEEHTTREK